MKVARSGSAPRGLAGVSHSVAVKSMAFHEAPRKPSRACRFRLVGLVGGSGWNRLEVEV